MTSATKAFCIADLLRDPRAASGGTLRGADYTARVAIPDYGEQVARHYDCDLAMLSPALEFPHFGAVLEFATPTEIAFHDADMRLDAGLRALLDRFGAVRVCNAFLPQRERSGAQRNVFSSLRFHVDRGETQLDHLSMFWRDPFDSEQRMPRTSSTLILPNAVAYLQALAEGKGEGGFKPHYNLFESADLRALIGRTVLELSWDAPEAVGEIALIDNRRVLHASYYDGLGQKGYPISVRYLY